MKKGTRTGVGIVLGGLLFSGPIWAASTIGFNEDVRPILSKNCIGCHGPDPEHREKGLRLDTFDGATAVREGKQAVVPGQPDKGQLIARITSTDPDEVMPPPDSGHALKPAEIDVLRRWIAEGAEYEQHWALVPPRFVKPAQVKSTQPLRNPIDQFVVAALQERGLSLSPDADPATLIRRVALDLTGLPPDAAIAKRCLDDPTDANS